jgi:diadenosine tetraphosphate (Ap4A) HIT family hydrolase
MEFKDIPWKDKISEDEQIAVYLDKYPVTKGHILVVPKYNNLTAMAEAFKYAVSIGRHQVAIGEWDGFNNGLNGGEAAGQTVMYPHIHLIPRRKGDMEDPRGGVRHVIPEKGNYQK